MSSGVSTDLLGIFGFSANDIYVVGSQSTLLHYDGTAFTAVPGPAAADPAFTHVAGTSKNDLAVKAGTSVWTFDGKAWSEYAPYLGVVSLAGGPSGLLIAGGGRGTAHFRPKVGAPWGVSPVAYPFDGPTLPALAVLGQSAIVGGDSGGLSHWTGSTWDSNAAWLTRGFLSGIANDPDNPSHAVVVGGADVLERVGEGLWRRRVVGQGPRSRLLISSRSGWDMACRSLLAAPGQSSSPPTVMTGPWFRADPPSISASSTRQDRRSSRAARQAPCSRAAPRVGAPSRARSPAPRASPRCEDRPMAPGSRGPQMEPCGALPPDRAGPTWARSPRP